ncbi:hypothetical protein [Stutzerimonas stutzeri]|uniref:hypothetical protein n=1 Tax=Stutzerimonas stutzeri TaxID=316 RepID=UPI00210DF4A8|nr:hypothetical protein [Stutzerimonas stutzeri]MCQ4322420.1 hypothetical protein [Stutzerimonas stutzeri]
MNIRNVRRRWQNIGLSSVARQCWLACLITPKKIPVFQLENSRKADAKVVSGVVPTITV